MGVEMGVEMRPLIWMSVLMIACVDPEEGVVAEPTLLDTGDASSIADLDPATLPSGETSCRSPALVRVLTALDGDTLDVRFEDQHIERVRLIGVDTPELGRDGAVSECYAQQAWGFLQVYEGRRVWLTFDARCTDIYDRTLAYVHLGGGSQDFLERILLRDGYATAAPYADTPTFQGVFAQDEAYARSNALGLWSACR